jgi:hypothetical protein
MFFGGVGDLKPSSCAISARVGGYPLSSRHRLMKARISAWRGVSFNMMIALSFYTVTGIIYSEGVLAIIHFRQSAGRSLPGRVARTLSGGAWLAEAVVKCETARSQNEYVILTFHKLKRMFQTSV